MVPKGHRGKMINLLWKEEKSDKQNECFSFNSIDRCVLELLYFTKTLFFVENYIRNAWHMILFDK